MEFGERNKVYFKQYLKANPGAVLRITPVFPESNKQRKFYHGAVLPLWAYLDGKDYRDSAVLRQMHEVAKLEFNTEYVVVKGRGYRLGKSTKGREALTEFLGRLLEYLVNNYAIEPSLVLDPQHYKNFIETIYMHGKFETYIEFLIFEGRLGARIL